jgi:hypothetical protein
VVLKARIIFSSYKPYIRSMTSLYMCAIGSGIGIRVLVSWHLVEVLKDGLSLFALSQAPNLPLSNLMSLPEEQDDKEKRKHLKESHYSIRPVERHELNPASDVECNREAES